MMVDLADILREKVLVVTEHGEVFVADDDDKDLIFAADCGVISVFRFFSDYGDGEYQQLLPDGWTKVTEEWESPGYAR